MRVVLLGVLFTALLTACGLQSAPPPVETVAREPIGQTTDPPIDNDGHGFRTPPKLSAKPPPPPPPPLDEAVVQAEPPPAVTVPEVARDEQLRSTTKKSAPKKLARPVDIPPSKIYAPEIMERRGPPQLDDILGQLRQGNMAFKVEQEMFVDEQSEATLVIDTTTTQAELEKLAGPGAVVSSLLVSKVIVTKLIAPTFEVTAVTPERQPLIDGNPTKWQWLLKPLEEGKHKVTLSVTAVLKVDGQSVERFIVTFERDIFVHVTVQNRVSKFWRNNWQWMVSTLLLPLGVWAWHRRRKRD